MGKAGSPSTRKFLNKSMTTTVYTVEVKAKAKADGIREARMHRREIKNA